MVSGPLERSPSRVSWIVAGVGLLAITTVAVGLRLRLHDGKLGTVSAPFVAGWLPEIDPVGAVVALLGCAAVVGIGTWLVQTTRTLHPAVAPILLFALSLGAGLALNVAREGTFGWIHIFDLAGGTSQGHAINEYLPGLPALRDGIPTYLDRFAEIVPSETVNIAGHPPGPLLLAHWLGATTPGRLAALVILLGTLCAPLAYRLGLTLTGDERTARLAGVLCLASPLTLLFGVTSYDYAFAGISSVAAAGLVARSWSWRVFGFVVLALASVMSWALLGVGAWAVLVVWRRDGFRIAVAVGAGCGVAILALQGFLAAQYGYDPIGTLRATEQVYRDSLAQIRPYTFWVFGSPVAWGLMLGPWIVAAAIRGAAAGQAAALAIVVVVLAASLGGFTKAETERIWLFMVPLACVAAAPWLARRQSPTVVLTALVTQALIFQLLMNTVW